MRGPRPFIIIGAIIVVIVGLFALGAIVGDGDWGPRHDGSGVTIVNPGQGGTVDGQPVQPGSVVVIDNGRRGPGFFPFFPLVPLFFFGLLIFGFVIFGRRFRRGWGGPGYGPGGWGGPGDPSRFANEPPAWFDRWHEQAHAASPSGQPANASATTTQSAPDAPSTPAAEAPAADASPESDPAPSAKADDTDRPAQA